MRLGDVSSKDDSSGGIEWGTGRTGPLHENYDMYDE